MSSSYGLAGWSLLLFVMFLSLKGLDAALNGSSISPSPTSPSFSPSIVNASSTVHLTTTITTQTTAHVPSSPHIIVPSSTHSASSNIASTTITTPTKPQKPNQPMNKLSSFGIVMLSFGGILIVVLIVSLMVICCHGRERGPERTHIPHSNVKMKPWKSAELSTTNELTEDTIDQPNHSQSHQNVGLTNSPQTSPNLTTPSSNNNKISTPTGTFRNLQTHSPGGDLGEFGRKLSLGRQAYEPNMTPNETKTEHKPAHEAKGEQDDMTIHFV